MNSDPFFVFMLTIVYLMIAGLILYQIELRLNLRKRIKCRQGKHERFRGKCKFCGDIKDRSHLTLVQGGKKDLKSEFKF